ncbi:hypothetical protein AB0L65_50205 [Nonomuraea sp. NPDC052116]|uniref:hypothetical protein n=1 Tax=Nonomuraea sp. NPDC052116 TaxID=3155665 RepID=UPI00342D22B0
MSFDHTDDYTAPHGGTAIPDGYRLSPDDGNTTWFAGALITFRAKAAGTRGVLSFFQCDVPYGSAGFEKFFEDLGEPATVPSMPTHQTRDPSVEELLAGGQALGWEFVEPRPRRLPGSGD